MPTASYFNGTDYTISAGSTRNFYFNPTGDSSNATVTNVDYTLYLGPFGSTEVDLGRVEVFLYSPNGERQTIFDIVDVDELGVFPIQDDSVSGIDQDSDTENDHDLYYDGSGPESSFSAGFDGNGVNGNWRLEIRNRSDDPMELAYHGIDVDYTPAPDLVVSDIKVEGLMEVGETLTIKADISNISTTNYTDGFGSFDVQYLVNGSVIGTDTLDLGFLGGLTLEYEESFTVTSVGPAEVEVRIVGTSGEATTANNSRTEYLYQEHDGTKTLANSAEEVRLAAFLAHSAYGDVRLPEGYNGSNSDNGIDDTYNGFLGQNGLTLITDSVLRDEFDGETDLGATVGRFTSGGLYEGRSSGLSGNWEAQGLMAIEILSNGDRALIYGMRGTDSEDNSFFGGQAWTGNGLYDHYTAHRPAIEAMIAYANNPANGIDAVIVGGHSLGGSMVDIFAAIDAQRLKSSIDLTTVTFGSAGVDPDTYIDPTLIKEFRDQYDPRVVADLAGDDVGITRPAHHISLSHTEDRVTFDEINPTGTQLEIIPIGGGATIPLLPPEVTMVPSLTLAENLDYSGTTRLSLPLMGNFNMDPEPEDDPFEYGFGAEHNIGLYWANIDALTEDPLVTAYAGHSIQLGRTVYDSVYDYLGVTTRADADEVLDTVFPRARMSGANDRLDGASGRDWLLGLAGNDTLYGGAGDDLLSGGAPEINEDGTTLTPPADADRLYGGEGNDRLSGGYGDDYLNGGAGNDTMMGGLGNDFYIVGAAGDQIVGEIGYAQGGGIDTVRTYVPNYVQPENVELVRVGSVLDTFSFHATGNDAPGTLVGNAGNNILNGRGGDDQINGNAGDDTLIGGVGRDVVVGGDGADVFVYSSVSESRAGSANRDIVNGLTHGVDRIDLSAVDAVQTSYGDDAFVFIGSAAFSGTAGEMRTQGLGGANAILVEMDVNGDGVANMQIFVNLTTYMQAGDFIL